MEDNRAEAQLRFRMYSRSHLLQQALCNVWRYHMVVRLAKRLNLALRKASHSRRTHPQPTIIHRTAAAVVLYIIPRPDHILPKKATDLSTTLAVLYVMY